MDRRTFIKISAGGVALAMLPLSACDDQGETLPEVEWSPGALAHDARGTRFEVLANAHRLVITDATRSVEVGRLGAGAGELNYPCAVAVHRGLAYVVECGNHRVQVFDAAGTPVAMLGVGALFYPKGIAVSGDELLVADSRNARVVGFTPDGVMTRRYGEGVLSAPLGIVAVRGGMLVADPGLRKVVELDRTGQLVRELGAGLVLPYGVAFDGTRVYVADAASSTLTVLDRKGRPDGIIALEAAPKFLSYEGGTLYAG